MEGSGSPHDELGGFEFDFEGDIDPVLWHELSSGQDPGDTSNSDTRALRCVDETHRADCTRCTPCPPPDMGHKYELVGEEGQVRARCWARPPRCALTRARAEKRAEAAAQPPDANAGVALERRARRSGACSLFSAAVCPRL